MTSPLNRLSFSLLDAQSDVDDLLATWTREKRVAALWNKDAELWTGSDESDWLGWLDVVARQRRNVSALHEFRDDVSNAGFTHAVVLGMGGSSLCPEVLGRSLGPIAGAPELLVLDSTVPAQVLSVERRVELSTTLFIVASKSGSTAEPDAFERYFFDKVGEPSHFVAITDPGSALETLAEEKGYRRVWHGEPEIGGRFSALSHFGMVPAAAMGLDVDALLERAALMVSACGPDVAPGDNPGVHLGLVLGALALAGRDKVTFRASPEIEPLGAWLEQLIAESTGKSGKGILPVDREPIVQDGIYGADRVFVRLALKGADMPADVEGHPSVTIELDGPLDIAQELYRWEIATAVAGAVLGVNPFDQPDVESSKVETRAILAGESATGRPAASGAQRLEPDALRAHIDTLRPGDYFAINAYLEASGASDEPGEIDALLCELRRMVLVDKGVATTLGYGPRFLHSTGQLHKGGPPTGVFLQLTADDPADVPIPGKPYTFAELKSSQAAGDRSVLERLGRRVLSVHLGADAAASLRSAVSSS